MPEKDEGRTPPNHPNATGARRLTPGMRRAIIVIAVVVLAGIAISALSLLADGDRAPHVSPSASAPGAPGPVPGAAPAEGSEVQTPDPEQTDSKRLPDLPAQTPRVVSPLPPSASADGQLVEGFPTALMGPAPEADIISTSIATEGDTMQVTLLARTDSSVDSILQHYRDSWVAQGLREQAAAPGASELSMTDAFTSITLSFTPGSGTGTVYAIHAVLRAS